MTTDGVVRVVNKFPGGAGLHKELQGFASFVSFQNACSHNGMAMAMITQEKVLSEQYFGNPNNPDSIGISQQLVKGTGLFENMYDTEEIMQQTGSQQAGNTCNNRTLVLKPFLHCLSGTSVSVWNQSNQIKSNQFVSSSRQCTDIPEIFANQRQISAFLRPQAHQEREKHWQLS
jgi:hypothetical protein